MSSLQFRCGLPGVSAEYAINELSPPPLWLELQHLLALCHSLRLSTQTLSKQSSVRPCTCSAQPLAKDPRNSHTDFKAPPLLHPFFSFTLWLSNSSCISSFELDLYCSAQWDYFTLLGFHLPVPCWGTAGLISGVPFFWGL